MAKKALEGIRVLELALQYPGPYCTMLLADLGAEVLKVERPDSGDPARQWPAFFNSLNRNRRSLTLDLKRSEGREIFYRLVKEYDIVTEGFRPGVAKRLEIDYESLRQINHRIIYCSLSGYGQNGPYRDRPGHDLNYLAMSGMLGCFVDKNGSPIQPKLSIADLSAGMFASVGILAAVLHREKAGEGQYIDCSMFDGLLSWMSADIGTFWATARRFSDRDAGYGIFQTSDGKYITLGIAHEDWFWERLCTALGLDDIKGMKGLERIQKSGELTPRIDATLRTKTREEWMKILLGADVPVSLVQDLDQVVSDPQVLAREMVQEITCAGQRLRQVGFPIKLSATPASLRLPPPSLGEHTEEILTHLGYDFESIRAWKKARII